MTDERVKRLVGGLVPGALIGTGGAVLVGLVSSVPDQIALFFVGVGALAAAVGGLAWATSGSLSGSVGQYAGDRDFSAADARRNALRIVGLGLGVALGGGVAMVVV